MQLKELSNRRQLLLCRAQHIQPEDMAGIAEQLGNLLQICRLRKDVLMSIAIDAFHDAFCLSEKCLAIELLQRRRCSAAASSAASEALLQYLSNKFFAWGSGPRGDGGSVALEQRLQGEPGLQDLPGGAAPGLHSRHPPGPPHGSFPSHLHCFSLIEPS